MKRVPIVHGGVHLGELKVVERSDWKNGSREPSPLDFEMARVALAAQALYETMDRFPTAPDRAGEEPWLLSALKAVCRAATEDHAAGFEEDVLRRYVSHYGMGQVVRLFGGDEGRISEVLRRFKADGG